MSTDKNQSKISEVRDQLSLDFADGKRLNIISSNLGINRPPFAFTDDRWRALVKTLALSFKQINNKFYDVLSVLFGPQSTQTTTLVEDAPTGTQVLKVNSVEGFPQLGIVVLDETKANEETLEYCYVDYSNKYIYLKNPTSFDHSAEDYKEALVLYALDSLLLHSVPEKFDSIDVVYNVKTFDGYTSFTDEPISTSGTVFGGIEFASNVPSGLSARTTPLKTTTARKYFPGSKFVSVSSAKQFPQKGFVALGASSNSFTVNSSGAFGAFHLVSLPSSTFDSNSIFGYKMVFEGNITAALTGVSRYIVSNDPTNLFYFPASTLPSSGDRFVIVPVAAISSINYDDNVIDIVRDIDSAITIPVGNSVEYIEATSLLSRAQVQVKGTGWDVIQSNAREVDLYLPEDLQDPKNIRTASYVHTEYISPNPSTTTSSGATAGDEKITVTSTADFPIVGVVTIDPGGTSERVGYYVDGTDLVFPFGTLQNSHSSGTTVELYQPRHGSTDVLDGNLWTVDDTFPGPYMYIESERAITPDVASTSLNSLLPGTTTVEMTTQLNNTALEVKDAVSFEDADLPYDITVGPNSGNSETLAVSKVTRREHVFAWLSSPVSAGDTTLALKSTEGRARNTLSLSSNPLDGETVTIDGKTYTFQLTLTNVDGHVHIGGSVSDSEDNLAAAINLGSGAGTDYASATTLHPTVFADSGANVVVYAKDPGTSGNSITVSETLSASSWDNTGSLFAGVNTGELPDAIGYRILIDALGGSTPEVGYVKSKGAVNNLSTSVELERGIVDSHSIGDRVQLMADVLTIAPFQDDHIGKIDLNQRQAVSVSDTKEYPVFSSTDIENAEIVEPLMNAFDVSSSTGLDTTGGTIVLNFGDSAQPISDTLSSTLNIFDQVLHVTNSSQFPTSYPFILTINKGHPNEVKVRITNNNTGTNELTIDYGLGLVVSIPISSGSEVLWEPGEQVTLEYDSISGNTISFDSPVVLESSQAIGNSVIDSSSESSPKANGYDFPLRTPPDIYVRMQFVLDLIRAAGVEVNVIDKR